MSYNQNEKKVPTRFTTSKVRLTYAFIWAARASKNDNDNDDANENMKYSTRILIPKNDAYTLNEYNRALQQAFAQGQKKGYWGSQIPNGFSNPLHDGDTEAHEKGEEYIGHLYLNTSTYNQPKIIDINQTAILDELKVYSGCYARVAINLKPFKHPKGNRGIRCELEAIMKLADGTPLGGVPLDLSEAFGDWSDGSGDLFEEEPVGSIPTVPYMQQSQQAATSYVPQSSAEYQYLSNQPAYPQHNAYPAQSSPYPVQQQGSILPPQSPTYPQQQQPMQITTQNGYQQQIPALPSDMPDHLKAGVAVAEQQIAQLMNNNGNINRVA